MGASAGLVEKEASRLLGRSERCAELSLCEAKYAGASKPSKVSNSLRESFDDQELLLIT